MTILSLLGNFILFLLFLLFFLFISGAVLLVKVKIFPLQKIFLSVVVGLSFFLFLSFWLGFLELRILILPINLIFLFLFLKKQIYREYYLKIKKLKINFFPFLIVLGGALFQSSLMFKSGWMTDKGILFWGVNGYDGVWHMALTRELVNNFPPQNPGFAGELLKNYHFLTDLLIAQINYFFKIPILDIYFRFFPLIFSLILNSLVYFLTLQWTKNKVASIFSVFFFSFTSSFGWVLNIFGLGSNNWETAFWGAQTPSAFLNPPFALSLILISGGLILLNLFIKEKNKILIPLIALILGLLVIVKIYGAIVIFLTLSLIGGWRMINKKDFDLIKIVLLAFLISGLFYWKSNITGEEFLIWKPWWFIRTMIEAPDRVNWVNLEMRRQFYSLIGEKYKVLIIELIAFLIFLVGNLGSRICGFLSFKDLFKRKNFLDILFLIALPISFFPPLFFIQKGVAWNTIQFLYYFIFFFGFLAGWAIGKIWKKIPKNEIKILIIILLIVCSLPSAVKTFWWYNAPTPTTILEKKELEGLNFLKRYSSKEEIILTYPYYENKRKQFERPPIPLTYYNSSYVSFFSERRVYLEDQNQANILGYPWKERLKKVEEFFQTKEKEKAEKFLKEARINYIYLVDDQKFNSEKDLDLPLIFNNGKVRIFKVNRIK
ncbi:MAG: hypothetical protein ACPLKP_01405 [Microgenomates group bacterium]